MPLETVHVGNQKVVYNGGVATVYRNEGVVRVLGCRDRDAEGLIQRLSCVEGCAVTIPYEDIP